jgi:hypothetical protein
MKARQKNERFAPLAEESAPRLNWGTSGSLWNRLLPLADGCSEPTNGAKNSLWHKPREEIFQAILGWLKTYY